MPVNTITLSIYSKCLIQIKIFTLLYIYKTFKKKIEANNLITLLNTIKKALKLLLLKNKNNNFIKKETVMSLASFSLPDLQIRGKCCNYSNCGDCCNPGDRIIMHPPPQGSNEPTINVSTTKCCLFCIRDNGSADENRMTWQVFHHYLELAYGKQAAEFALGTKSIDLKDARHFSMPLSAEDYQELKEIAEHAFSRQSTIEAIFKWAKLRAAFERVDPLEIKETPLLDGRLERIGSIHVEAQTPLLRLEPFNVDKIKRNLRQVPLDRKLEEDDIERITLLVLDDILAAGKDVLKRDEIQAKMLRYLKALGFSIKPPEYYEKIAPLALRTLHKTDINALSPDEYAAYLQLASTLIMKKPSPFGMSEPSLHERNIGYPVTLTSSSDSKIMGHIQFIGPAHAIEEIKSTISKGAVLESSITNTERSSQRYHVTESAGDESLSPK